MGAGGHCIHTAKMEELWARWVGLWMRKVGLPIRWKEVLGAGCGLHLPYWQPSSCSHTAPRSKSTAFPTRLGDGWALISGWTPIAHPRLSGQPVWLRPTQHLQVTGTIWPLWGPSWLTPVSAPLTPECTEMESSVMVPGMRLGTRLHTILHCQQLSEPQLPKAASGCHEGCRGCLLSTLRALDTRDRANSGLTKCTKQSLDS